MPFQNLVVLYSGRPTDLQDELEREGDVRLAVHHAHLSRQLPHDLHRACSRLTRRSTNHAVNPINTNAGV